MPSTIAPIDATRGCAVQPAKGLRYGNFEGVRNLPPVQTSDGINEQNFWEINNEQICSTVCQWMETWQPWQQRTLLCGVANRCSISQLEIFSTILEPLNHRDYKTQSLQRYPSAPFKASKPGREKKKKKQAKDSQSAKSKSSRKIPLIVTDDVGNVTDVRNISNYLKKENSNGAKSHGGVEVNNSFRAELEKSSDDNKNNYKPVDKNGEEHRETPMELSDVMMGMDQYVSILSSSILISAINEASTVSLYDKFQFSNSREASAASMGRVQIEEPDESEKKTKPKNLHVKEQDRPIVEPSLTRESTVKSITSNLKSRPLTRSSQASSTRFLGGTLEFSSDSCYKKFRREASSSSNFRHSAFASSIASTTDFFSKQKISKLGPMQHTLRTGSVQRPLHLGPLPVSLQKYYKNARWWPTEPPMGTTYHQARKQELALNFNEQLNAIWKWLSEWESYEQIAFIKRVAMMCVSSVLDALLTHIQQRLRDSRDINRLPDKLLLYVFSFLPPQDILQTAKVCRRWRFLCAMDELWMLKCLEIGEQGGVSNISELVQKARQESETARTTDRGAQRTTSSGRAVLPDTGTSAGSLSGSVLASEIGLGPGPVDWMLACSQLSGLIHALQEEKQKQEEEEASEGLLGSINSLPAAGNSRVIASIWAGIIKPTAELNTGVREKLEMRRGNTRPSRRRADNPDGAPASPPKTLDSAYGGSHSRLSDLSDDMSGEEEEEDLNQLMEEYNILKGLESVPAPQPSRTPRRSEVTRRGQLGQPETLPEESTPTITPASNTGQSRATSKRSEKKDDQKDTGLDIRTDLTQSRDILGKMVSKTSLEWETPETYNDYMRITLFAGELKAVKRMRKLQGHVNCINCLHFDKRRLVTCGLDRVIRLWDVRSGRALHKFYGHKGGIRCVQFDNDIMATGSWDCLILIWSMRQFTNVHTLQGHTDSITCLEFNGDFLVSGSDDRSVRLWRRPTFLCMLTIWFEAPVMSLVIVDHNFVVSTSDL
ncbi:F-box/WD repeat-containing protein 7 [Plakobranchus ocellatus]|uniref:F-box/WD repeat-containing protein 7 n=1 Tax=Plakobranchus ocellatus TaxID=259542 RepID=A0AAV4A6G3_9GAST|nr:F-box/WD repeat-containing protein 7 [Plakobranchus ocellatus]